MGVCFLMTKLLKNYEQTVNFQLLMKKSLTNGSGKRRKRERCREAQRRYAAKKRAERENQNLILAEV
jgi:hypothetical protein